MNTFTEILKSLPLTAFRSNSAGSAYTDITGRGVALSATPTLVTPINAGSTRSMRITTPGINFPSGVFIRGQERREFSLEATILPTDLLAGSQAVMSHTAVYDGLAIINRQLRFTIEFNTLGSVYVSYDIPENYRKMVVLATYSPGEIKLYVNGTQAGVAEITEAQVKDGFKVRANNNLYLGAATGSQIILMDSVAVYPRALTDAEAYMHFLGANRAVPEEQASASIMPIRFDGTGRNIYSTKRWSGTDFSEGLFTNSTFNQFGLVPQVDYVTQLSKASTWIGNYEMPTTGTTAKIYGVKIEWSGTGTYAIAMSKDGGATWVTPTNNSQMTTTFDWAPTGQPILVRVTFTGGIASDPSLISDIRVTSYLTADLVSSNSGRKITFASGNLTSDAQEEPIFQERFNGIANNGVAMTMGSDTDPDDPKPIAAIEIFGRFETTLTNNYIFDNRPDGGTHYLWSTGGKFAFPAGGVLYYNGVATATTVADTRLGVPFHVLYVFPATFTTSVSFNAPAKNFHFIKVYSTAPTAADAARIFNAYLEYPTARLATDSNPVTESGTAYKTYGYDWSITQAG